MACALLQVTKNQPTQVQRRNTDASNSGFANHGALHVTTSLQQLLSACGAVARGRGCSATDLVRHVGAPGDHMVEARDAQLLDQEALRLHDLRDGHKAVGHKDVDLVQHGRARDHLQQHRRHAMDLLPIVQAHACRQAGLALSPKHIDWGDFAETQATTVASAAELMAFQKMCSSLRQHAFRMP